MRGQPSCAQRNLLQAGHAWDGLGDPQGRRISPSLGCLVGRVRLKITPPRVVEKNNQKFSEVP